MSQPAFQGIKKRIADASRHTGCHHFNDAADAVLLFFG